MKFISQSYRAVLSKVRPLTLLPILLLFVQFPPLDGCCGGGCGCGCSYGCYQPQQQVQVQQQPIYIPYPVPVNNNNNNGGAAARSYRNYVNGGNSNFGNTNNGNNNNRNTNANANTDQAQTNALLASLVTQLQRSNALNSAASTMNNNNGNENNGVKSGSGGTSYSNNNAMKALQEAAQQQQQQQQQQANANNNQNALLALLAQLQQLQQPPTTLKTTTPTTTTTTQKPFSFDLGAALQSFLSHFPMPPPPPPTTTTTTTPAPTTPKPILLSAEQVDQLRNILAAIGGSAASQPNPGDQVQRARAAPKGLAALIAQDAAGGAVPSSPVEVEEEFDEDDVIEEEFDHPPEFARAHPMTSRLMTMLHMADALDQMTAVAAPEIAHARPISSRIVSMINPEATNGTANSDPIAESPTPPGPSHRPLINVNIPIPPSERDPSIINENFFAWENGAFSVEEMGKFIGRFHRAEIGGFEKLNPAPEDNEEDEELDEEQLHNVPMDFYYKFDTYDARDSIEHADLGDEAFEQMQSANSDGKEE